jgi:hypothetical protein
LLDVAKQVDLTTVQHAHEIQRDRLTDKNLRGMWFWTADFPLYTIENNEVVLYLADCENNLIFKNLDDAVSQLRYNNKLGNKNNYFPNDSDIGIVINSASTLKTELSDLKLQNFDNEWLYFEIYTASKTEDKKHNYDLLNSAQRAIAEKVHGQDEDFNSTMSMLNKSGKAKTRIYVLNPDYVKKILNSNDAKSLARISILSSFNGSSNFRACNRSVDDKYRRLRGVQSEVRIVEAQKMDQYDEALKLITENPNESLERLQKNPTYATGLNALIGSYLKSKA